MNPQKATILVADDDEDIRLALELLLMAEGYQVIEAGNAKDVMLKASHQQPDLILLDVTMPDMDGYEVCRRLKKVLEVRDIPVIFVSAHTESEDIVLGFSVGAVDYVAKPFNIAELIARIGTHIQLKREIEARRTREIAMAKELEQARRIQKALLPKKLPQTVDVNIASKFMPMAEVGGDFYHVLELDDLLPVSTGASLSFSLSLSLSLFLSLSFSLSLLAPPPSPIHTRTHR